MYNPLNNDNLKCRCCGASSLKSFGALPKTKKFAGAFYEAGFQETRLLHCSACRSMQRHPIYPQDFYQKMYQSEVSELWTGDGNRRDHPLAMELIISSGAASVLDVGCGSGDFLRLLPASIEKFAIEPSTKSHERLQADGIKVVSQDFRDWNDDDLYDCVTVIDVIEHLEKPADILDAAIGHVADNGLLIISTGNPESSFWQKIARSRFWYSAPQEHITFPSPKYLKLWANENGFHVESLINFKYRNLNYKDYFIRVISQFSYMIHPRLHNFIGRTIKKSARGPNLDNYINIAGEGLFKDHYIIAIRKSHGS